MSKILVGAAVLSIVGVGLVASASAKENKRGGPNVAPNGTNFDHLAEETTADLMKQDVPTLRADVARWSDANDLETASFLAFVTEQGVAGAELPGYELDGQRGSPTLRAFGLRVLQLESRTPRVEMWARAWETILPSLSAALREKAKGLGSSAQADAVPNEATLRQISDAVLSGDPDRMRQVAARLDGLGFAEQAEDLRAMADLVERGAKADPSKPEPLPEPDEEDEPRSPGLPQLPSSPSSPSSPSLPASVATSRVVAVKAGEGAYQIAQRLLGRNEGARRWTELRTANVPPFKKDSKGQIAIHPGELLNVPKSWPAHPDAVPGVSPGPNKTTAIAAPKPPSVVAGLPSARTRLVVVKKGEGVYQVAQRLLGSSEGAKRWKELRTLNVPPFKTDKAGNVLLQPGDRLKVPPLWPPNATQEIFGGDGGRMNPRQLKASRVLLGAHFNQVEPQALAKFQRDEGIEATGSYGPATAHVLHQRFGMVPPVPHTWGSDEPKARARFARAMYRAGKRDPQRADEFRLQAKRAEGRAP